MDNKLPTDDNQKTITPLDNLSPSTPPEVSSTPPEETPITNPEPNPQIIPETPEEKPPEKPTEPPKPEAKSPTEQPIEIGSLGQPSLSTFQDIGSKPKSKSKKIKNLASVLGLLLIITSLPLTVLLVKQRQEIRKEAQPSGSISLCGITVSPTSEKYSNGTYTLNYSITSNDGKTHKVVIHTYGCVCSEGNRERCGTDSGKCTSKSFPVNTPYSGSVETPNIGDCGTHQADVFVISVDDRSECHTN